MSGSILSSDYISSTGNRRSNNPQYMKEWWQRNPKKYLLASAKSRAKRRGLEFNLTENDITIPENCPILGIKLNPVHYSKQDKEFSPCLDRVDNTKGYIKGNVAVISFKANRLKSELDKDILERLLKYVLSYT